MSKKIDYTQRAYDKLCMALTMEELCAFLDILGKINILDFGKWYRGSTPADILISAFIWSKTKLGDDYWKAVYIRLGGSNIE
jgi:hypothetical protein